MKQLKPLKQRVQEALARLQVTQFELCELAGINRTTLNTIVSRGSGFSQRFFEGMKKAGVEMYPSDLREKLKSVRDVKISDIVINIPTHKTSPKKTVVIEIDERIMHTGDQRSVMTGRRIKLRIPANELEMSMKKYSNRNPKTI